MNYQDKLDLCNLQLELKLERCDNLVQEFQKAIPANILPKGKRGRPKKGGKLVKNVTSDLPKKRKNSPKFCWGCLEEGKLKNMHVPHYVNGFKEVYADMAKYCFSTQVKKDGRINYICDMCIQKLRDTLRFRKQILIAQDYLNQVTGGPSLKLNGYTGQEEIKDVSNKGSLLVDKSSKTDKHTVVEPKPTSMSWDESQVFIENPKPVVNNSSSHQFGATNMTSSSICVTPSLPFHLVPVKRSTLSSPIYIVSKKGEKQTLYNITNRTFINNSTGKKVILVSQTPKSQGIINSKMKRDSESERPSVIVDVQSSSDEDVQVIENEDSALATTSPSPHTTMMAELVPIEIDNKHHTTNFQYQSADSYIQDEYSQQSDYITYQDFNSKPIHATTENLFNSIPISSCCFCPVCHLEFPSVKDRRDHLRSEHPDFRSGFMCEECGATLLSNSSLNRHVRDTHLKRGMWIFFTSAEVKLMRKQK